VQGARGGRVLHTPSGLIPPELMKAHVVKQQEARQHSDEEEEY